MKAVPSGGRRRRYEATNLLGLGVSYFLPRESSGRNPEREKEARCRNTKWTRAPPLHVMIRGWLTLPAFRPN